MKIKMCHLKLPTDIRYFELTNKKILAGLEDEIKITNIYKELWIDIKDTVRWPIRWN